MIISFIKKRTVLILLLIMAGITTMAQGTAPTEKTVSSGYNQLAIVMGIMAVILAFVIWGMGQVLITLGKQVLDKNRSSAKLPGIALMAVCLLFVQGISAQDANTTEIVKVVPNYGGLSSTAFYMFLTVIGTELVIILFLAFSIKRLYVELLPEKKKAVAKRSRLMEYWSKLDKKLFTKAIPVEKEDDLMLDHDYDGIRELDNSLPPWWKYGFYITIAVAFIYLLNFHVLGLGKNPDEEYATEMENAMLKHEAYEAKNKDKVDENNVPMADANGIKAGQEMFEANCVACHVKGGGGNVGPNLTDDYWLHKGSLNDIYKTIKNGYPDKGMQAWNTKFNPKEISQLAGYIKSLRGTNPPGAKLPQGEMYMDSTTVAPIDSSKLLKKQGADTTKVK